LEADYVTVVEDRPIMLGAVCPLPVIIWLKLTAQQSHGLLATAELLIIIIIIITTTMFMVLSS